MDRNPAWARFVVQNNDTQLFDAVHFDSTYEFMNQRPGKVPKNIKIYEAHVGMSTEHGRVTQYREFADQVLPHIVECGYNCVQLMAIQEHSYYGSFGYHVTSYFATSSR